ncbi:zf-CHCC domain-containing protein [Gammaproteobacteria bacterium]
MNETHTAAAPWEAPVASNAQRLYTVTRADLPLHCPMPGTTLWNSHPKVFLAVEKKGGARCPYCGAEYLLRDE